MLWGVIFIDMKLTESDLVYIIKKCVTLLEESFSERGYLHEGASSILYHWISAEYLLELLRNNRFSTCDPEYSASTRDYYAPRGKDSRWIDGEGRRHISFTRNGNPAEGYPILKYGEFGDGELSCMCRLTLDGDMLNRCCNFVDNGRRNNFEVHPMDWANADGLSYEEGATNGKTWMMYSGSETYSPNLAYDNNGSTNDYSINKYSDLYHHPMSQAEDRLTTTAEFIPNASKYIKKIDVYIRYNEENAEELREVMPTLKKIQYLSKRLGLPCYFHKDIKKMYPASDKGVSFGR